MPRVRVRYRVADVGEIPDGRLVDIRDWPGGQAEVRLDPGHTQHRRPGQRLAEQLMQMSGHQAEHGTWRQRWTGDGRMSRPPQGLMLAVSRWETVPADDLPSEYAVYGVAWKGGCIWLVSDDYCTPQLCDEMNDLLLRLAGDGLWMQTWLQHRRTPVPLLASPPTPLFMS